MAKMKFNAGGILGVLVISMAILYFIGNLVIPFLAPVFGDAGVPDVSVIENFNINTGFAVIFITLILFMVIKLFTSEKLSGRTIGIAILLGVGLWWLTTNVEFFSFLKDALAQTQSIVMP